MGLSWKFPNHIDFDWFHGTDLYAMIHIYIYNLIYNRYMYTHIFTRYVHIYICILSWGRHACNTTAPKLSAHRKVPPWADPLGVAPWWR